MKNKIAAVLLMAGLTAVLLAGCGDRDVKQDKPVNTQEASQGGSEADTQDTQNTQAQDTQSNLGSPNASDEAALSELTALFDEISSSVEVGTAGSTLKAVPKALALMDWATKYELDDDSVKECVQQYLSGLQEGEREEFAMQLELVCSDSKEILGESGQALLDDSGCEALNYPYDASKLTELDAVVSALP